MNLRVLIAALLIALSTLGGAAGRPALAAAPGAAEITSPASGTALSGNTVTFQWSAARDGLEYWLSVGTTYPPADLFNGSTLLEREKTLSNLPLDGKNVFVRLWTRFDSGWVFNDYFYTAAAELATIITPTPRSVLAGSTVTFTWTAGIGAMEYWLDVGRTDGSREFSGGSTGLVRSRTVNGIPMDSSRVFVKLWTKLASGWKSVSVVYTADQSNLADLTAPTPGSVLPTGPTTFTWTPGTGALEYWIGISRTPGGAGAYVNESTALNRTFTTSALPFDGTPINVRLWTRLASGWANAYRDYPFTAASGVSAAMISPVGGSTLTGSSATFTWDQGVGAGQYWLSVGTSPGGFELLSKDMGSVRTNEVVGVPVDGKPIYVRLWSKLGTSWVFRDYPYFAFAFNPIAAAPVNLRSVAGFAVLAGSTITNTGQTQITGDMGLDPGTGITGFPPGVLNGSTFAADPTAATAKLDLTSAYNDAAGRSVSPVGLSGNLGGLTLPPGLYKSTGSLEISSGDLTLDAKGDSSAVFIFQIATTLSTTTGRSVILAGNARAANITWQVGTSATIGGNSVFKGTILSDQSISLLTGASLEGRAAARIGAVTMDSNLVTVPVP